MKAVSLQQLNFEFSIGHRIEVDYVSHSGGSALSCHQVVANKFLKSKDYYMVWK